MSNQNTQFEGVLNQTLIQIVGRVIGFALGLLTIATITRILSVEDFGRYITAWSLIQLFGWLTDGGLNLVFTQEISKWSKDERDNIARKLIPATIGFRLVINLIALFLIMAIVNLTPFDDQTKNLTYIFILFFFLSNLSTTFQGWWQQKLSTTPLIVIDLISKFTTWFFIVIVGYFKLGLTAVVLTNVLGAAIGLLAAGIYLKSYIFSSTWLDLSIWKQLWIKTWPLGLMMFFTVIYFKGDTLFITWLRGNIEAGWYGVAYKVLEVLVVFPGIFAGLILPILAETWHQNIKNRFIEILDQTSDLIIAVIFPMIFLVWMFGDKIILLIGGNNYTPSIPILSVLIVAVGIIFMAQLWQFGIIAMGDQKKIVPAFAFASGLSLIFYYFGVKFFGGLGAALVTVLIEGGICLVYFVYLKRKVNLTFWSRKRLNLISLAVILALAIWSLKFFGPWYFWVVTYLLVYIYLIWGWVLPKNLILFNFKQFFLNRIK